MPSSTHSSPRLAAICGIAGIIGCLSMMGSDILGNLVVENYSPISETISDLAAGRRSWILDTGLQVFAASIIFCAVALFTWKLNGRTWRIASVLLALLGIDIFVIAVHNQYGNFESGGLVIHSYLVYFLGIAFALAAWMFGDGLREIAPFWRHFSRIIAVIWAFLAPIFFVVPSSWNGAYERLLAVLFLIWFVAINWLLIRRSR